MGALPLLRPRAEGRQDADDRALRVALIDQRPGFAAALLDPSGTMLRDGLCFVSSGRIDNRAELARELGRECRGPATDSALMAAAYAQWGEAAADRLRGDFAFVAWQPREQRLLLARDCFGALPLFYSRQGDLIVFGTLPSAMLATGLVPRTLDEPALAAMLEGIAVDRENTVYREIRRVPRASQVLHTPRETRSQSYWRPRRGAELRLKGDADYAEAAREVLAEVLKGHLAEEAPLGVMLSGGFDSGAIAAMLARLAPQREIHCFTCVPVAGDPAAAALGMAQEWRNVEALGALYPNLRLNAVSEKPLSPVSSFWRECFEATGLPIRGHGLLARRVALAEAAAAQGVPVLLRGDGANLTFSAAGEGLVADLAARGNWGQAAREFIAGTRFSGRTWLPAFRRLVMRELLPPRLREAVWHLQRRGERSLRKEASFLRADFAGTAAAVEEWAASPINWRKRDLLSAREIEPLMLEHLQPLWADAHTLLFDHIGVAMPAPFRDRRMVDFALALPADQLRRDGVSRYIARQALKGLLPEQTLTQRGVFSPFADAAQWVGGWWEAARAQLDGQHDLDFSAAAIDLPRLRARLDQSAPPLRPLTGPEMEELTVFIPAALHMNDFIRWHHRAND